MTQSWTTESNITRHTPAFPGMVMCPMFVSAQAGVSGLALVYQLVYQQARQITEVRRQLAHIGSTN